MRISHKAQGIIKDIPASDVPPEFFTAGSNIRFRDNFAERAPGYLSGLGTPSHAPIFVLPVEEAVEYYWIYTGRTAVAITDGTTQYDITPSAGWSDIYPQKVTGCILNALPILNNPADVPVYWDGSTSNVMASLPDWNSGWRCKAIRAHKYHLWALGLEESSIYYPDKVRWSDKADPGSIPASWTPAATNDAGSNILAATQGPVIDGLSLRGDFAIYKQHSCYLAQYVGGNDVYVFRPLLQTVGALSQNCIVEYEGKHLVLTDGDVVMHDGVNVDSLLQAKWRRWLFDNMASSYGDMSYLALNKRDSELLVCFAQTGSTIPDTALIVNLKTGSVGVRSLPGCPHIAPGIVGSGFLPSAWSAQTDTWETVTGWWNKPRYNPTGDGLLMADYTDTLLQAVDEAEYQSGTANTDASDFTNIVSYSEEFDRWNLLGTATVTADATTAPNGTTTADEVSGSPGDEIYSCFMADSGTTYTVSCYVKNNTATYAEMKLGASGNYMDIKFNFSTFAITESSGGTGSISASGYESIGSGWYRIYMTGTGLAGGGWSCPAFYINTGANSYYVWGLQVETGSTMNQYLKTNASTSHSMTSYVSRESLDLGDPTKLKTVTKVWPRITGTSGDTVEITLGYQMNAQDSITWGTAGTYTIGTNDPVDLFANGRYISYKISNTSAYAWKFHGIDFDYQTGGRF